MKKIFLFLISNLLISSIYCQNGEVQFFKINPSQDTLLYCNYGGEISVLKDAFSNLRDIHENTESIWIDFKVIEVYSTDEMILTGVTTESSDGILLSNGMIYLEASYKNKKLKLSGPNKIEVTIPLFEGSTNMSLYELNENNANEWDKTEIPIKIDTCWNYEERIQYEKVEVTKKEYKAWMKSQEKLTKGNKAIFGGNLRPKLKINEIDSWHIYEPIDTNWICLDNSYSKLSFNIMQLGWYNIDKLLKVKNPVKVKVFSKEDLEIFIVLKDKVCLKGYKSKKSDSWKFKAIPKRSLKYVIGYKDNGDGSVNTVIQKVNDFSNININLRKSERMSMGFFRSYLREIRK